MGRVILSAEMREKIIEMVRSGLSKSETARRTGIDLKVVGYWCNKAGLVQHAPPDQEKNWGDIFVNYIMEDEKRCWVWQVTLREMIARRWGKEKVPSPPNTQKWARLNNGKIWKAPCP